MTTVADLVAKLGFKVDDSGFNKFKNSLQAFQSVVREGVKDLREYAKEAQKISKAFQEAYLPTRREAKERYNAITESIRIKSYAQKIRAELLPKSLDIRDRNATSRARQLDLKEKGLERGVRTSPNALINILKNIAGFNVGGIAGGVASLAGISHPIVMAISLGVKAIVAAINLVMKTIRDGVKTAMGYRDYMAFTGRNTKGLSGLMAASLNTTNLTPEDIMKDAAGFEKQYWDMWFGGGNPRFWQMIGRLPTGNGETDLKTILTSVYDLTSGLKDKGKARSLLGQAGLSEEYITLLEDIRRNNPTMGVNEMFAKTREEIAKLEEGNKTLREWDRTWKEIRVELAKLFLDSNFGELLKDLVDILRELVGWLKSFIKWKNGESFGANLYRTAKDALFNTLFPNPIKLVKEGWNLGSDLLGGIMNGMRGGNTYNINNNQTNQVSVSSTDEASDYVQKTGANSFANTWWSGVNPAYRNAGATGG